jgi:cell division protein FtsQ
MYRQLLPVFEPLDAAIEQLELTDRGSWRVQLDSGAAMELGRGTAQEVLERTQRYVSTVSQATALYRRKPDASNRRTCATAMDMRCACAA